MDWLQLPLADALRQWRCSTRMWLLSVSVADAAGSAVQNSAPKFIVARSPKRLVLAIAWMCPELLASTRQRRTTRHDETADSASRADCLPRLRCCGHGIDVQAGGAREGMLLHVHQKGGREGRILLRRESPRLAPDAILT